AARGICRDALPFGLALRVGGAGLLRETRLALAVLPVSRAQSDQDDHSGDTRQRASPRPASPDRSSRCALRIDDREGAHRLADVLEALLAELFEPQGKLVLDLVVDAA